jgi:hypothetical protein
MCVEVAALPHLAAPRRLESSGGCVRLVDEGRLRNLNHDDRNELGWGLRKMLLAKAEESQRGDDELP